MKNKFLLIIFCLWFILSGFVGFGQGLPPGWDFGATPSTHIISIPVSSHPNINTFPLLPGDYIGAFYLNSQGELACGGAAEWLGDQNTGIIAFGDDSFTTVKDGFSFNEVINYKFYSWSVHKEYDCEVICNPAMLTSCGNFVSNGLSGIDSIWANGFYIVAGATPDFVCAGSQSQLLVIPSGGDGIYSYQWTSVPVGFTSSIANPVVFPLQNTIYNISVTYITEVLQLSVNIQTSPPPQSNAGNNVTICENSTLLLNGQQANGSAYFWNTDGDGTFSNSNILNPIYTPGTDDISSGNAQLTLTVQATAPCIAPAVSNVFLSIISMPAVFAGSDQVVCENNSVMVSATVLNGIELQWSTSGDGTFNAPNQLETIYNPGVNDIILGNVELTLSVNAISPCTGLNNDSFTVEFSHLPEVYAGNNQLICEDADVSLSGVATNYSGTLWTTSGDGSFENSMSLITSYFPGVIDVSVGQVELQLLVEAVSPCTGQFQDNLTVNIIQFPVVNAGIDATICETGNLQLNGFAEDYDEILWSSDGDGTFIDVTVLNTLYFPGSSDILSGLVQITLNAQPQFPCNVEVQDDLLLEIHPLPFVNAGIDATICENENLQLNGDAINFNNIQWISDGDGSFENPHTLNTLYYPGSDDIANGMVGINLNAEPISPCLLPSSDNLVLSIQVLPYAYAGEDVTIPIPEVLQLEGSAEDYSLLIWSTDGDGIFDDFSILDPVYTPGEEDIQNAGATIIFTAFPNTPCVVADIDELILTIDTLVSTPERRNYNMLSVFPNPSAGAVFVHLPENIFGNLQLQVFNDRGDIVKKEFIEIKESTNSNNFQLNLVSEKSGLYFISIICKDFKFYSKLLLIKE